MAQVSNHPVLLHKLALLRDKRQPPREFRRLLREITFYIGYEATRSVNIEHVEVESPMGIAPGSHLSDKIAIVPVLRAGLGMVDPLLELLPNAAVHHIGMYRMAGTDMPIQYYNRLPSDHVADVAFVLDPLIATGLTLSATIGQIKKWGCKRIVVVSVTATKEGLAKIHADHPEVEIHVASTEETLNENGRVVPGLGDAGERIFGHPTDEHQADAGTKRPRK